MRRQELFERVHVGLRIVKTGVAVWLSLILCQLLNLSPFFAVIAAVICMKVTTQDSIEAGVNRVLGTIIGGVAGMLMLYLYASWHFETHGFLYDLISVLGLMLLIKLMTMISRSGAVIISSVVFLSLLYMPIGDVSIFTYSVVRVVETLLGVVVAILVNLVMPHHQEDSCS